MPCEVQGASGTVTWLRRVAGGVAGSGARPCDVTPNRVRRLPLPLATPTAMGKAQRSRWACQENVNTLDDLKHKIGASLHMLLQMGLCGCCWAL